MGEPMDWSYIKQVRFSDSILVHYIPKDEDRSITWLHDRKRFERRVAQMESILSPVLVRHIASVKYGAKGYTTVEQDL